MAGSSDPLLVANLLRACARMAEAPRLHDERAVTYLASYPVMLAAAQDLDGCSRSGFIHLATLVYGWMPRIVRLRLEVLDHALAELRRVQAGAPVGEDLIRAVAEVLSSVVGASKLLHFWQPDRFPIWDSRIEARRLGRKPSQIHLGKPAAYLAYSTAVLQRQPDVPRIRGVFEPAFAERVRVHGIEAYAVSGVRMVEYLVFDGGDV